MSQNDSPLMIELNALADGAEELVERVKRLRALGQAGFIEAAAASAERMLVTVSGNLRSAAIAVAKARDKMK